MGLYRGGFGDAVIALFNKLLDYKIEKCPGFIGGVNSVSLSFSDNERSSKEENIIIEKVRDGSLWEPVFDGSLKTKINPEHPFYKEILSCGNPDVVFEFLTKMADLEMNSHNSQELKILENIRVGISRALWMRDY